MYPRSYKFFLKFSITEEDTSRYGEATDLLANWILADGKLDNA